MRKAKESLKHTKKMHQPNITIQGFYIASQGFLFAYSTMSKMFRRQLKRPQTHQPNLVSSLQLLQ